MALPPVSSLWYVLGLAATGWMLFNFTAQVLALVVGKFLKATVHFRFVGVHRLKDVSIHFMKGPLSSVTVGEMKLMLLNLSALKELKLQVAFSEVEVLLAKPGKSRPRSSSHKKSRDRKKLPGQSKTWPIIAKCAKHINLTLNELAVKVAGLQNLSLEIKELDLDTFQPEDLAMESLGVRLVIAPINIRVRDMPKVDAPSLGDGNQPQPTTVVESSPVLFSLQQFSVNSNLEYVKDVGFLIRKVEVNCGDAEMNLSEELLFENSGLLGSFLVKKSDRDDKSTSIINCEGEQALEIKKSYVQKSDGDGASATVIHTEEGQGLEIRQSSVDKFDGGDLSTSVSQPEGEQALEIKQFSVAKSDGDDRSISVLQPEGGQALEIKQLSVEKFDADDQSSNVIQPEGGQALEIKQSSVEKSDEDNRSSSVIQPEGGQAPEIKQSSEEKLAGKGLGLRPEKFCFHLPMFSFNCSQKDRGATFQNKVGGLSIRTCISESAEESGELSTLCDMRLDCGEICILEENDGSLLQLGPISVAATTNLYAKGTSRQRVKIDANLEGTRCNLFLSTVDNLLKFCLRLPRKTLKPEHVLDQSTPPLKKKNKSKSKLRWICTISAPKIQVAAYDTTGITLFRLSSESLIFFVRSVSGPAYRMKLEVGKLEVTMVDDIYDDCTSSRESNSSRLIYLGHLMMEQGNSELHYEEEKVVRRCSVITVDCSQIGVYLSAVRLRALLTVAMAVKVYVKNMLGQRMKKPPMSGKPRKLKKRGGWKKIEFGVKGFSIQFHGPAVVDEVEIEDPKTVNFGEQGGRVVLTHNHDGVLRTASIKSTSSQHLKERNVLCKATFEEVFGLVSIDNRRKNVEFFLDRGEVSHEEVGSTEEVVQKLTLLAIQNFEVLYEEGGRETSFARWLLVRVTNVDGYWEPDVHLFYYDVSLQLAILGGQFSRKSKEGSQPVEGTPSVDIQDASLKKKVSTSKQKLRLAVDLEKMIFTAKVTQNISMALQVQSLVSEDVEIGLLVENIYLTFNDAQVLHFEQAQVCKLPCSAPEVISEIAGSDKKVDWNLSIHATKIRIIMPFRLQFRVIEDAVEDMWRVLKLVMRAQKSKWKPVSLVVDRHKIKIKIKKPAGKMQSVLGSVCELTFEIEEEPLQGWLDEHHCLMGREVCKLLVQEKILEKKRQEEVMKQCDSQSMSSSNVTLDNGSSYVVDPEWEKMQKEAFNAYRRACESLIIEEGTGACKSGLQSGFRMSKKRRSLLLVQASDVEMNLTSVEGSMIETIRKLDCVSPGMQVPYAKAYGRHLSIQASALVAQIRDYSSPLVKTGVLECEGDVIVAQQATAFPPQMRQEVSLGRLRTVEVWRSISGATPAYKSFFDLSLQVDSGDFSYGVGYEPVFADLSYAFSVALAKAKPLIPVVKKERSLPWWDDMRYYIHGKNSLKVNNFTWSLLATTDPYEEQKTLQLVATIMDMKQSEGSVVLRADDFEWVICRSSSVSQPQAVAEYLEKLSVLHAPEFKLEISMDWQCESGNPFNHYLHPFPNNANPPTKRFDLFRSTSLSLTFAFSLFCPETSIRNSNPPMSSEHSVSKRKFLGGGSENFLSAQGGSTASQHSEGSFQELHDSVPMLYFGSQELKWIIHLWNLLYLPPHKLRSFSRWPRYGIPRVPRSGNLSLDKVMTEYLLKVDATPVCIKHHSTLDEDPAHGLTFRMQRLRYELLYSRCQSHFDSYGPRDPLLSVYQGLDLSMLNAGLDAISVPILKNPDLLEEIDREDKVKELLGLQEGVTGETVIDSMIGQKRLNGRGFLLSIDNFTLRKQAPKAGLSQLSALLHYKKFSKCETSATPVKESINISTGDHTHSDASDDEGFSVVLADNCLRVSVYGLKLLWTLPNRDAVWSWVEDFSGAFESPKPSPSRQYAQRRMMEMKENRVTETPNKVSQGVKEQSIDTPEEEGVMHFMVNVVQPQFNLHSEDAHGRLLLAAASGRVLARSFHSILAVGLEVIAHALQQGVPSSPQGGAPVIAWKRRELSVILEHVQAHVAPTNIDLGAGLQWLPKIPTGAPKVRRTGALLERVFMPCSMYFQYTRHKGGTTDVKVKPLKELSFNSPNITATMTSNQFHIIADVISNLLLARLPKPRKRSSVHFAGEENCTDDDGEGEGEEEVDEVVPEGVEEVEAARIKLEQAERDCFAVTGYWALMENLGFGTQSAEIQILERELAMARKVRRTAFVALRSTLQRAAQQRLMEKEKHRTPLAAMRISWAIDKFVWSMLCDGEPFAEAEISSMILNVDRDFNDFGVARFTTKWFAVKHRVPGAKSSMVLSPWNPPAEWGRNVMLRVDAKQGAPKDGHSPLELFQVEIYPLKIYLTESMYTMMWDYLFPGEDHDSLQRQTARTQHQKANLPATSATLVNQGRNTSLKTVDAKETEMSIDEMSTKGTAFPSTLLRASTTSRLYNSTHEDLQSSGSLHSREQKTKKASRLSFQEEKKITEEKKTSEEKKVTRQQKRLLEFHNIRISQVELLVTYEGSPFSVNDLRLLMDTFTRLEFTGSWRRLFSKVKKHIVWSVLKSVTGMQGKKFKDKLPAQTLVDGGEGGDDSNSSDSSTGQPGPEDQFPISRFRKHRDRAGEGFVSSIRGLFNSQGRKAKALMIRKLSIDVRNTTESLGYPIGGDADLATSPHELGKLMNTKRLLKLHSRQPRLSPSQKGGSLRMASHSSSSSSSLRDEGELSDESSASEDQHD